MMSIINILVGRNVMYWEFISIFLLSLGLIWLLRYYAPKIGLIDIPNGRSMHLKPMPRGEG